MILSDITIVTLLLIISIGSFLIPFFFGRFIAFKGVRAFVIICSFLSVCLSSLLLYINIIGGNLFCLKLIKWIKIELVSINFGILIDPLTVVMLFVVSIISFCANIYSMEYLHSDPHIVRYFSYLALFTFFMLVLVSSENLIQLFIG